MRRVIWLVGGLLALALVVGAWFFYTKAPTVHIPDLRPAPVATSTSGAVGAVGETVPFLKVPEGFVATYYAKNIPDARVMEFVPGGMLVSQPSKGVVSLVSDSGEGALAKVSSLISDLNRPHGLATRCFDTYCDLYVATHDALIKYRYDTKLFNASNPQKILDLEASPTDRHKTRTLLFLASPEEDTLLISVGSSCDSCIEKGNMRGKILAYNTKTGVLADYATGLRNAVFMTLDPVRGAVYATEMGRDMQGDNLPPDEVNKITPAGSGVAQNFGWPYCYGKNIRDTSFESKSAHVCSESGAISSWLDLPAHSAPLGLAFIPEEGWPEEDRFSLLVAYHGSWNRTVPTGYKIVQSKVDARGIPSAPSDFITGWLSADGQKYGRPADIRALPGGVVYITDDEAGVIYKIRKLVY